MNNKQARDARQTQDPAILKTLEDIKNGRIPCAVQALRMGQALIGPSGRLRITRVKDGLLVDRMIMGVVKTPVPGFGQVQMICEDVISHFLPMETEKFMDITEVK
jgi:hypothetical protein